MKLERFDKNRNYKKALIITLVAIVLLGGGGILIYKTFALYETKKEYNVLEGTIGRFQTGGNDITLRVKIDNKDVENFPKRGGYKATSVQCTNGASGTWNNDTWGIEVGSIETNTTCTINFNTITKLETFEDIELLASMDESICNDYGIATVSHKEADIPDAGYSTYGLAYNQVKENLKETEYRYCGSNPNNYVTFNNEKAGWRIIGLVNTPEGERIKLIRNESIGKYSWNNGKFDNAYDINDWNKSVLMQVLNSPGAYYNQTTGTCYDRYNSSTSCDFRENSQTPGLTKEAKEMIDTVTWNLGGSIDSRSNTIQYYNYERGTEVYKGDNITRSILWKGEVGLMYPSDYGYATGGGTTYNRGECLQALFNTWPDDCSNINWLYKNDNQWTLTPGTGGQGAVSSFYSTLFNSSTASNGYLVSPTIYLKTSVNIISGKGTTDDPYILK